MQKQKIDFIHFMIWMRNGIAFAVSWVLFLLLIYHKLCDHQVISTDGLIKIMVWTVGAVFLFNLLFTRFVIKKWNFITRLTVFMVSICLYEGAGFYWMRGFIHKEATFNWLVLVGIVFALYLICILIYQRYSKKKGELYTRALQQYQQKRSIQNGK